MLRKNRFIILVLGAAFLIGAFTVAAQDAPTAMRIYGQPDAAANVAGHDANGLSFPVGLAIGADGSLYVADRNNSRVLVYANDGDTTADRVYGHNASFTAVIANDDGSGNTVTPSADNFNQPPSVALDAKGGLYVADRDNHRVLYFADDGDTSADWVFGQGGSFTTGIANNDGAGVSGTPSATSLNRPQFVYIAADGSLYISDTANNRVLMLPASMLP